MSSDPDKSRVGGRTARRVGSYCNLVRDKTGKLILEEARRKAHDIVCDALEKVACELRDEILLEMGKSVDPYIDTAVSERIVDFKTTTDFMKGLGCLVPKCREILEVFHDENIAEFEERGKKKIQIPPPIEKE